MVDPQMKTRFTYRDSSAGRFVPSIMESTRLSAAGLLLGVGMVMSEETALEPGRGLS